MKKSILNLKGAQELSKNEQKSIQGGKVDCGYNFRTKTCKEYGLHCAQAPCRLIEFPG